MVNPVVVEVTRGNLVESRHRGAVAVVDADGNRIVALGEIDAPVYPRSAVKVLQALVMVESGASDRYGFGDEELALACASHSGEPGHVDGVAGMLARVGLDAGALQCGTHWPLNKAAADALVRAGQAPSPLHHNCSGKHAGFLCAACAMGDDHQHYTDRAHPVQREVRAALEAMSGETIGEDATAVDGCSVPTFALPLAGLARAFARAATGHGLAPGRAAALRRLRMACAAKPWHVAGTGQFVTEAMRHFGERVFVKGGAEGVYCAALPEQGVGAAVKCEDGAGRAAEVTMAALLLRLLPPKPEDRAFLAKFERPALHNWRGLTMGEIRATPELRGARA